MSSRTGKTKLPGFKDSPINKILFLQKTIGNKAVQRLFRLQRQEDEDLLQSKALSEQITLMKSCPLKLPGPNKCPFGGACDTCPAIPVQIKPTINKPGDRYEQKADHVADELTHFIQQSKNPISTIQRKIDKVKIKGCSIDLELGIGIYGKRATNALAAKWQNWINTLWKGNSACFRYRIGKCPTAVKAKVTAHPSINWWWKVPESNSVYVREPNYRSYTNVAIDSGDWAVNEDRLSVAHETGHLMGQGEKYWRLPFMGQKSQSGYVNDIMANYYLDPGPTQYSPALSRIVEDHNIICPCCLKYPPCQRNNCALNPGLKCSQVGEKRHCLWIYRHNTKDALKNYNVNCGSLPR